MLTPHTVTICAQVLLTLICAAIGFWTVSPIDLVAGVAISHDRAALGIAFYAVTCVAVVAFPRMRRNDIALLGLALAAFMESTRAIVGHDAGLLNLVAAAGGVLAAWAPGAVEEFRRMARLHPFLSFREIHQLQERRSPGGLPRGRGLVSETVDEA